MGAERKCTFPPIELKSGGKKTCRDRYFITYQQNNNCEKCPIARGLNQMLLTDFRSPEEKLADRAVKEIVHDSIRRARGYKN